MNSSRWPVAGSDYERRNEFAVDGFATDRDLLLLCSYYRLPHTGCLSAVYIKQPMRLALVGRDGALTADGVPA